MRIVITGGIGSGKSTVTELLSEQLPEYRVYSIDKIVEELYQTSHIKRELQEAVGTTKKEEISKLFFFNEKLKEDVETIFNKRIYEYLAVILRKDNIILEFPLLFEKGLDFVNDFDFVVSVICDETIRRSRAKERCPSMSEEKLQKILDTQVTDDVRFQNSNIIIKNERGLSYLRKRVEKAVYQIRNGIRTTSRIGIVSGSFDPITYGHCHIIKTALSMVDRLHVVLAHNSAKKYMFTKEEKQNLVNASLHEYLNFSDYSKIIVSTLPEDELIVSYATQVGAKFIFRGIRDFIDLKYENELNLIQKRIDPTIETVFFLTPRDKIEISSSMIKGTMCLKKWESIVKDYIPQCVFLALQAKKETL